MVQFRVRMAFQMSFPMEMVIDNEQDIAELVAHRLRATAIDISGVELLDCSNNSYERIKELWQDLKSQTCKLDQPMSAHLQ